MWRSWREGAGSGEVLWSLALSLAGTTKWQNKALLFISLELVLSALLCMPHSGALTFRLASLWASIVILSSANLSLCRYEFSFFFLLYNTKREWEDFGDCVNARWIENHSCHHHLLTNHCCCCVTLLAYCICSQWNLFGSFFTLF